MLKIYEICHLAVILGIIKKLDETVRNRAKKAFELWIENPFHPSLHFKCINSEEEIWSVRITLDYRALGVPDGDTVTWFWIGSHKDYERYF
jgi:mRNA-degrading endonuclease RelE of RelBE toxin-antitoxin system